MKSEVTVTQDLIPAKTINVPTLFTDKAAVQALLGEIDKKAREHEPDLSTGVGRKAIASNAHKVAQSKTFLDNLGKEFVAGRKAEIKVSDSLRKLIRDTLDDLKVDVRKDLTDWEKAEEERKEQERLAEQYAQDWDDAHAEHDLFLRQKEIERKEAELAKQEEERKAKEEAERLERERIEREKRIAEEATEKARKEAEEKALREKEESERREREAKEAAERAEKERIAAVERAKIEKEMAIKAEQEKARQEAERVERERLQREAEEKAKQERIARNKAHRGKINREALACFVENGFTETVGKSIIELIATGKIKHIEIKY